MASYSRKLTFIALIMAIAIPTSIAQRERWRRSEQGTEQYLRGLCSRTSRSDECWKILKPELNRFNNADGRTIAVAAIDLAIAKSDEIHDKLNQLYQDSGNDELKEKYISCSKNYKDANRDLTEARRDLDSGNKKNIVVQLKDAEDELRSCRREFGERESFDLGRTKDWVLGKEVIDPAHIRDRNRELGLYLEIVSVAIQLIK